MKFVILGALLGLLIVYPALPVLVATTTVVLVSKPVVVAFALGLAARPHLRRWSR